ncbi:MAG TPA: hypothetical protein VHV51_14260 [Polyangiaceae bacterium]|jgi:hypothetical protein|nr:hypothetical protein [Polyangiaceae bacterium]
MNMSKRGATMWKIIDACIAAGRFSIAFSLMATGCDSGNWVDGSWLVGCQAQSEIAKLADSKDPAEVAKAETAKQGMTLEARATCSKSGKAFTGDFRCENGSGQVKCK